MPNHRITVYPRTQRAAQEAKEKAVKEKIVREYVQMMRTRTDTQYAPGDKVRFLQSPHHAVEYGIVVCCWKNTRRETWECYVTFYGNAPPDPNQKGQPDKPYIMRYCAASLTPGWTDTEPQVRYRV